jgi:hypothetical protein
LGLSWGNKPMLGAYGLTCLIEGVFAARFFDLAIKSICELGAVIGQNLLNVDRAVFLYLLEKIHAAILALIGINFNKQFTLNKS